MKFKPAEAATTLPSLRARGRAGSMGKQDPVPASLYRARCGPGQRLAVPLSTTQKRRRYVKLRDLLRETVVVIRIVCDSSAHYEHII